MFNATIWDVAVAPAWQRSGLGRALMERLTRGLVEDGIPTITLYAEPKVGGLWGTGILASRSKAGHGFGSSFCLCCPQPLSVRPPAQVVLTQQTHTCL